MLFLIIFLNNCDSTILGIFVQSWGHLVCLMGALKLLNILGQVWA